MSLSKVVKSKQCYLHPKTNKHNMHICLNFIFKKKKKKKKEGAQWLSGRVLDSRPKGRGFEPHRRHCVVVLEQDTFILA